MFSKQLPSACLALLLVSSTPAGYRFSVDSFGTGASAPGLVDKSATSNGSNAEAAPLLGPSVGQGAQGPIQLANEKNDDMQRVSGTNVQTDAAGASSGKPLHNHTAARRVSHTFIHLADPQLGMYNMYDNAKDWFKEMAMFRGLVDNALKRYDPDFMFVGGDMQNFWPNEKDQDGTQVVGRNAMFVKGTGERMQKGGKPRPWQSDEELLTRAGVDLGTLQREAVKAVLYRTGPPTLWTRGRTLHYTAGNHDIGDSPDPATLAIYLKEWGPLWDSFEKDGIHYLQFTSQFYACDPAPKDSGKACNEADPFVQDVIQAASELLPEGAAKETIRKWLSDLLEGLPEGATMKMAQNQWLSHTLKNLPGDTTRVVLLTHIPPFMAAIDEPTGWANWIEADRLWLLELLQANLARKSRNVPILWVCGHFHTNVGPVSIPYGELNMAVVVASSCGSPMWWDGAHGDGHLEPTEAAAVASKVVAGPPGSAFFDSILTGLPNTKWNLTTEFAQYANANIVELIQPYPTRSGMRVFVFYENGDVETEWRTLQMERNGEPPASREHLTCG